MKCLPPRKGCGEGGGGGEARLMERREEGTASRGRLDPKQLLLASYGNEEKKKERGLV